MDATIEDKQQYLRIEILEAGYDPEDFIEFMNTNSSIQSPSIENLTLGQLSKIVNSYKEEVKRRNKVAEEEKKSVSSNQNTNTNSPGKTGPKIFTQQRVRNFEQKKTKIQYDRYGTYDYEYKATMNCTQSDKLTAQPKIYITVPDMETKETQGFLFGIGSKVEYYYLVKSNLMKGTVKRNSDDFDWLNNTLLRLYPFLLLPQLEPVRKDIKDPYVRRQKDIEEYLQHLSEKKYLAQSYVFIDFLTLSLQKMQKYKKSYDSMGFAKGVSLLKTQQGTVQLQLSNRSRQLYNSSKDFTRKTAQIHDTLSLALTKMLDSYRTAIADTYTVVDMFAELHDVYGEVHNKFPVFKKEEYNDTLVNLNNLFLGIGDNFKHITDSIDKYTKDYYRFYNGLDRNMQKLQKLVKQSENQYLQFKTNLQRKRERVISDPSKWQIESREIDTKKLSKDELMKCILPKDGLAENELKAWYAYNLKNYENQLVAYLKFVTKRYQKVFRTLAVDLLGDDKIYMETITKFISDGKKIQSVPSLDKSQG